MKVLHLSYESLEPLHLFQLGLHSLLLQLTQIEKQIEEPISEQLLTPLIKVLVQGLVLDLVAFVLYHKGVEETLLDPDHRVLV